MSASAASDTHSSSGSSPVAIVADAGFYVGPPLARLLAQRGFRLVIGDPSTETTAALDALGAEYEVVTGARNLAHPDAAPRLVTAALERFGRLDSAVAFSGVIVTGRFLTSTADDLHKVYDGCMVAPYQFLQAVLPPMIEAGAGQVLVITSASGARPTPGAPLYSAMRAGANHLVRNVAGEVARHGVQVNAVGTNFMDFPEFRRASGADDPAVRARLEAQVPLGRLGTVDEFAHFCGPFLDGTSRFTTGQFVSYSGGWS
ncbi:MAG: SDR family NAD(P)-dependent oxidoreductase [Ilumatobacteraceae bacterium]